MKTLIKNSELLLTTQQAAKIAGCSQQWVARCASSGQLPSQNARREAGGANSRVPYLFRREDVIEWAARERNLGGLPRRVHQSEKRRADALARVRSRRIARAKALAGVAGSAGAFREAVGRLPEEFREPMALVLSEGLSYPEIAERLGRPVGTVRSRISRAKARLLEALLQEVEQGAREALAGGPSS